MSNMARLLLVAMAALLAGGLACPLVGCSTRATEETQVTPVQRSRGPSGAASTREFAIEGMMCQGCADTITAALAKIPGVQSAKVSLADKKATVVADPSQVPSGRIEAAITDAGYKGHLIQGATKP